MSILCSSITCRLTNQYGNVVSPYNPSSIIYSILYYSKDKGKNRYCRCTPDLVPISIEGYVSIFSGEERVSPPIPFSIFQTIRLNIPSQSSVTFQVKDFHCCAIPFCCGEPATMKQIRLLISIDTIAISRKDENLQVPQVNSSLNEIGRSCIYTPVICDKVWFTSRFCMNYKNDVSYRAEVYQYNTIADGVKRSYDNSDELTEYGNEGILSPNEVSYYNVFVNGVMQPKANYILQKGKITFTTQCVPAKGRTIIILFTTWKNSADQIVNATVWQYNAISDGTKKVYTNSDEIQKYGNHGIPSPCEVSYSNLYINGVLQPQANYYIRKGVLTLTTADAPTEGSPVILESIIIRSKDGNLFQTESPLYNAYSNGGKIYTDQDAIQMYGNQKIPSPNQSAFQNLFVNSVIQPHVNFRVQKGILIFNTTDSPTAGAPITLQSVKNINQSSCCNVQMSHAALAQMKKIYFGIEDSCTQCLRTHYPF